MNQLVKTIYINKKSNNAYNGTRYKDNDIQTVTNDLMYEYETSLLVVAVESSVIVKFDNYIIDEVNMTLERLGNAVIRVVIDTVDKTIIVYY